MCEAWCEFSQHDQYFVDQSLKRRRAKRRNSWRMGLYVVGWCWPGKKRRCLKTLTATEHSFHPPPHCHFGWDGGSEWVYGGCTAQRTWNKRFVQKICFILAYKFRRNMTSNSGPQNLTLGSNLKSTQGPGHGEESYFEKQFERNAAWALRKPESLR